MRSMLRERLHRLAKVFRAQLHHLISGAGEPFVYIAIGDSTVEGVGASHSSKSYAHLIYLDLARQFGKVDYHNFGKRGARVQDVATRQLARTIELQPKLVTLSVGANDIIKRTNPKLFRSDLESLLAALHERTRAVVVMTNIPDFSFTRRIPRAVKPIARARIRQYNRIIAEIAAAHNATVIDTFQESARIATRFPSAVSSDNFHPSDLGYTLWANTMLNVIHELLRPKLSWWERL